MFERTRNAMLLAGDDRVYVDCNQAAVLMLESSRAQIVGKSVDDFTPVETRAQLLTAWATMLSQGGLEGSSELLTAKSRRITVEYSATANFLPGLHLAIFTAGNDLPGPVRDAGRVAGERLSPREREVLGRIALGASGPEIADELFISTETVRTHLRNVMAKLGARTRPHAVALALQSGEITTELIGGSGR